MRSPVGIIGGTALARLANLDYAADAVTPDTEYGPASGPLVTGALTSLGFDPAAQAVHGITQGPRLETAAEIERMARDGCDIVGMTGMPEAALAREAGLEYACAAIVVNKAAGRRTDGAAIHTEIETTLARGMVDIERLLGTAVPRVQADG